MRRSLAVVVVPALLALAACPKGPPDPPPPDPPWSVRDCTARFRFDDGASHQRVVVSGAWSGWSETADRLERQEDGSWALDLELPEGDHPYKLIVDGEWRLDPANPFTMWEGGVENSRMRIPDCTVPALEVVRFERSGGDATLEVAYVDGTSEAGPDAESASARLDGAVREPSGFDLETGRFVIEVFGLAAGKHRLEVAVSDAEGRAAEPLHLPFWVESQPFSWDGAVIYFTFTDRFRNGDPTNDGPAADVEPPSNYQGGDFEGIRLALEEGYFDDLGVEVLWLSPVQRNPDGGFWGSDGHRHTGYHGYWPSAARETQPRFGTLDELRALVDAAHARGIRVIADVVFNHVHAEHPYASRSGWVNGDGGCVCGSGGCGWDERALDCWFTDYLPDLDWRVSALADAMVDDALWWVREVDLDGFRVDAVKHFERTATRNLRGALERLGSPGGLTFHLVGETYTGEWDHGLVASYVGPDQLHGQFDFPLYWTAVRVFARDEAGFRDLDAAVLAGEATYPEGAVMSPFVGNHDIPRFHSHAAGDIADLYGAGAKEQGWSAPPPSRDVDGPYRRALLALTFVLTQPGTPLIYYGDEVGLPGAGDPDNRRFMKWGTELSAREQGLLAAVQTVGTLRREVPALRVGARRTLHVSDDLYVYVRDAGGTAQALVMLNRSTAEASLDVTLDGGLAGASGTVFVERLGGARSTAASGRVMLRAPAGSAAVWVAED